MTKKPREYSRVVGLMSGTSLDGVDAACIEIDETQPNGAVRVLAYFTQPYSLEMRAHLFALCENGRIEDATRAHFALGEIFAQAALSMLEKCDVSPRDVLCIGSHGQTISHLPPRVAPAERASTRDENDAPFSDTALDKNAQSRDARNENRGGAIEKCATSREAVRQGDLNACDVQNGNRRSETSLENLSARDAQRENRAKKTVPESASTRDPQDGFSGDAATEENASTRIAPSEYRGGATLQIGAPAVIAERTGIAVVSDFRSRDLAAGGQGAPLVPFADFRLLRSETENRIVQNIGGIANLTWLPRGVKLNDVRAFDTGPGNMVIDECVRIFSKGARHFDENGALAASGKVDKSWLAEEMKHPFFAAAPPKSTGREEFGRAFASRFYAQGLSRVLAPSDILATATALCAHSIADSYRAILRRGETCQVIVGGGGARNGTLLRFLQNALSAHFGDGVALHTHEEFGISSEAKEAVAFALLAHATMCGVPSNVPSATGAKRAVVLGSITL